MIQTKSRPEKGGSFYICRSVICNVETAIPDYDVRVSGYFPDTVRLPAKCRKLTAPMERNTEIAAITIIMNVSHGYMTNKI